ncbi:hypothetical protein LFLT20_03520 [Limosilactobacillus fermentum]|nr:hypothetical protein LFLT20_03520 [Limosilactobacillus fermentum]
MQRTVADLEEQMNQLGEQQEQVETQMADPDVATDIGKLTDLQKELDALTKQLEDVEEQWTAAAERLEEFDN